MPLKVTVSKKEPGIFVVSPVGSIDTETHKELEKAITPLITPGVKAIVLDMKGVDYISSMGLSVLFKARKSLERNRATLILTNLKPEVKAVFELIKTLPKWIFETMEEANLYLDTLISMGHEEIEG